jgi:hypothetical protein
MPTIVGTRKVRFSREEVDAFREEWPGSALTSRSYWFQFGDDNETIDVDVPNEQDGGASKALEGKALAWLLEQEEAAANAESDNGVQVFLNAPGRVHYLGMTVRPCFSDFLVDLEYTYFRPGTAKNDELLLRLMNWEGQTWAILSVPTLAEPIVNATLEKHGLKATIDSVPVMISGSGEIKFPLRSKTMATVEGSSAYYADRAGMERRSYEAAKTAFERVHGPGSMPPR